MEKLSRTLQTERNNLKEQLKQFIIEDTTVAKKQIEETTEKAVAKEVEEEPKEAKTSLNDEQTKSLNAEELVQEVVQKQAELVSDPSITNTVVTAHIDETALSN